MEGNFVPFRQIWINGVKGIRAKAQNACAVLLGINARIERRIGNDDLDAARGMTDGIERAIGVHHQRRHGQSGVVREQ